jgi:cyclomaltodextrinase / maltogenic alpha-amylase / neopullulanase
MKRPNRVVLKTIDALRERQSDPRHTPPPAQPLGAEVEIVLAGRRDSPDLIVTDRKRDFSWRVAMLPAREPDTWTTTLRMPTIPTILSYHFEFPDKIRFYALRQIESLIPASPFPTFGEWTRLPFQIAVYDPDQMPPVWTHGQVMYQIFPDRFSKSDQARTRERLAQHVHGRPALFLDWDDLPENPPKGRDFFGGNLRGITQKLDYLVHLGIDCLYMTPIFEAPTNHRYDAMDYFQIDPLLGSEQDLVELVEQTHSRGLRIVLDAVFNHCSNDSKYFNQSGWYGEDVGAYRSRSSPFFRMFTFKQYPKQYQGWVGVKTMPEFVECPEHEEYFLGKDGVTRYWMRTGIDGWRTDVTPWMSDEFWRRFRKAVRAVNPEALIVAEEWNDASHYLVGDSFDATMNYRFSWALRGFFALDVLTVEEFDDRLDGLRRDTPPPALLSQVNLVGSHDTARVLTVCGGDKRKVKQMLAFLLAYPGSPMICYGDEVGLEGQFAEDARRAFPWGGGDTELQTFVRGMLQTRRDCKALRLGTFERLYLNEATRTYAFARHLADNLVVAAFNAGNTAATLSIPLDIYDLGLWKDALNLNQDAYFDGHSLQVELVPRSAAWYYGQDKTRKPL